MDMNTMAENLFQHLYLKGAPLSSTMKEVIGMDSKESSSLKEGIMFFCKPTGAHFTYNNTMKAEDVPLLKAFKFLCKYEGNPYYSGAFNNCCTLTSKSQPLMRCTACNLVAYCDRNCQKKDWKTHKMFCKTFHMKNGKNVLIFDDETRNDDKKWDDAVENLMEKAFDLYSDIVEKKTKRMLETIFSTFSRVCNICKNAQQDQLFDCLCCCVAYCCKAHQQEDKLHKDYCEELGMFPLIDYLIIKEKTMKQPYILNNTFCTQYEPISNNHLSKMKLKMLEEFKKDNNGDLDVIPPSSFSRFDLMWALQTKHLAFPLTVLYNLQWFGVGKDKKPIQTVSSLNVHIVTFMPEFDSSVWEYLMHLLPALMELNITFINSKEDMEILDYQDINLERCNDCKKKGRVINYSVHRCYYHMFFSSDAYTEPDVVAVFGNISPHLMYTEEEQEHPKISFRNMTYSNDTLLILTDASFLLLMEGIQHVCDANSSLEMVLPPKRNPMCGSLGARAGGHLPILNFKKMLVWNCDLSK
ncbi:unnamed protein product [Meganyctiphanes norvegica]|uniref:MYND-type domain-containing protein n=1 Tax=Meganyctiphanes norvegica TaxID=48144 RepID=A0AAV2Q803_MEGNR